MLAGFGSTSYSNDPLVVGELPLVGNKKTLVSGQNRTRGAVLGRTATAATVGAAVADVGNTGNGALTLANPAFGPTVREGRYRIVFVEPNAAAGTFVVEDPDGVQIGKGNVAVAFDGALRFTIADATDYVAGDSLSVDVSAVTYKYKHAVAAATDGSARPVAILAEDCDASAGDKECLIYERGDFNDTQLNFGAGHSVATVRDALRALGIWIVSATPA